jgi:acetyltransferase
MSTRNLEFLFKPASVALITADPETSAVGAVIARNLSTAGFPGMLWAVAPHGQQIGDLPTFSDLDGLPRPPDLAVLVTAPDYVAGLIAALGSRGTRAVAVVTGTWAQDSVEHARGLCSAMLNAARPYLLRFVGPHSLGLMVPGSGLNASFAHTQPLPGNLAFVAQSSAVLTAVLDWATSRNIGFSHLVSLGEMPSCFISKPSPKPVNSCPPPGLPPGSSRWLCSREAATRRGTASP